LLFTLVLGLVFLFGQVTEYTGLWSQGITISSNLFGTQFYTLTGLHFLHVSAGASMLAILLGFAWRGRANEPSHGAVQSISYYWHFVDIVWVILLAVVYLIGA
jgi:heme/copper-type cytochrome/quinol oxidase subunit 3